MQIVISTIGNTQSQMNCSPLRFALLLLLWSGVLSAASAPAANWSDSRVFGPFVCRADFSLAGHEQVFNDLADIQRDLIQRLSIPQSQERIEVYLFKSRDSYNDYVKQWFPQVPYRRALYVKNNGPGMVLVYLSNDLATDIRHECTHALLHAALPMVPLWLDEGLAEYYEMPPAQRTCENPHRSSTVWYFRLGQVPPLRNLEVKRELSQMGRSEYRNAWAWVHFMIHGPPAAREELVGFLADIRNGAPPGELSSRLASRLSDPEAAMVQHFKTFKR